MFDHREIEAVSECIRTGTLTSTKGSFVKTLEERFAQRMGVKRAYACASGSAAVHCAIAAIDPEPGDEIITTSITDMGALAPIVYQGAVPVFADVDPKTLNVTAETIAPVISERTKAIIVTHLFGNPCRMAPIMELAARHGIPVIEDAAQAFLSADEGKVVGGIGTIGCFSLQQGKHMTTGEGGMVTTNDEAMARRMFLFINKAWGYGDAKPDHYFLALNYRMSELQGAVAVAQLEKLDEVVKRRIDAADALTPMIAGLPGVATPVIAPGAVHVYWKYCLTVDSSRIRGGAVGLAGELKQRGIASAPRYIQKPAFRCQVFAEQRTFGNSRFPFNLARPEAVDYDAARFPGTFSGLEQVLVLPWNELYTPEHIEYIADSIREAVEELCIR
ncbi:MAG: DegT/DnrJ/EryC1/StrS family aminotransferase [Acidobacteria bacterium]|nr:DegT/DnrJ/EryC1/StrS family aminotransferase [Acidobacteriota bacterium]